VSTSSSTDVALVFTGAMIPPARGGRFQDCLMFAQLFIPPDELDHIRGGPAAKSVERVCAGIDFQAGSFVMPMERAVKHVVFVGA